MLCSRSRAKRLCALLSSDCASSPLEVRDNPSRHLLAQPHQTNTIDPGRCRLIFPKYAFHINDRCKTTTETSPWRTISHLSSVPNRTRSTARSTTKLVPAVTVIAVRESTSSHPTAKQSSCPTCTRIRRMIPRIK